MLITTEVGVEIRDDSFMMSYLHTYLARTYHDIQRLRLVILDEPVTCVLEIDGSSLSITEMSPDFLDRNKAHPRNEG